MQKIQIKSTQADMCLQYLKKVLFIYLLAFLKHLRKKSQRTKISEQKLLITSWASIFMHLF